ncbi:MAG: 30S ribosomal protein S5 [Candidatus Hydrogenedentota bacterium]
MREIINPNDYELEDRLVSLSRVAKVVKGGKNLGFRAVIVVGNKDGVIGIAVGKANEVPEAIRKGVEKARKNLIRIPRKKGTIPHGVIGVHGAAKVILKPASPGTGVIAGGPVRAILEAAGIKNCLAKSLGANNAMNVVKATVKGLLSIYDIEKIAKNRGKTTEELKPSTKKKIETYKENIKDKEQVNE